MNLLTIVTADIEPAYADDLIAAYEDLLKQGLPDGLLQTRLIADGQGHWAIQSLWRDHDSLEAMRASGEPPAAPALFKRFGAEPSLAIMQVLADSGA